MALRIVVAVIALLGATLLLVVALGARMPVAHVATRSVTVPASIDATAAEWGVPVDELRLWVLIQELVTHAVLSRPHVGKRLESLLIDFAAAFRPNPEAIADLTRDCLQPLPLLDDRELLVWFKARASRIQRRTFDSTQAFEPPALVRDLQAWNARLAWARQWPGTTSIALVIKIGRAHV